MSEYEFDAYPRHLEFYSNSPREAEVEDDVANSGVFSPHRANVHAGDGVFATNFALPGYAQRENLLGKSEVIDRQTGTPIEVYVTGATSAAQYMQSTQPRYPWPSRDGYVGGAVNKARMDDRGRYATVDISEMPANFLGPVTNTTAQIESELRDPFPRPSRGEIRELSGLGDIMSDVPSWLVVVAAAAVGVGLGVAAKRYL